MITGKTSDELHQEWMQNPNYVREYDALEEEFALAAALIDARGRAGLSQGELAERMHTSQSAVARLEGGSQNTSIKTLKRFAEATGSRLRIQFEPMPPKTDGLAL
jgi:ribosome-binding protein aMBF1 (putative translation factor)